MQWRTLARLAIALRLMAPACGYGTTISIGVSYCPAIYSSSSTTSGASTIPSVVPGVPIVLTFAANGTSQYLETDGTITSDSSQAAFFALSPSGQLMGGNGYVSTAGDVASQPFAVSSDTPGMKRASRTYIQFVIGFRNILGWLNDAFTDGKVIFCYSGSTMMVVFDGVPSPGCTVIELVAIPAADIGFHGGISTTGMPQSAPETMTSMSTGMSGNSGIPIGLSSTPNAVLTTSTTPLSASSRPGPGLSTLPASSPSATHSAQNSLPSPSPISSSPSGFESAYPAPTTTGNPNCYDRSPFDGTVNDNNLILCDTDLPGYDLEAVPASDIAACIDACSSYVPSSQGPCVAVVFDILASSNPCHLKYAIDTVNRGANAFSQAAIVVNQPYAPDIVFSDPESAPSSASSMPLSSTTVGPPPSALTLISTSLSVIVPPTTSNAILPPTSTTTISVPAGPTSTRPNPLASSSFNPPSTQPVVSSQIAGTSSRISLRANPVASSTAAVSSEQQQPSTMTTSRNMVTSPAGLSPLSSSHAINAMSSSPVANSISSSPAVNPISSSPMANPISSSSISSSPQPSPISSSPTTAIVNPVSTSPPGSSNLSATSQATSGVTTPPVSTVAPTSSRTTIGLASTTVGSYCSATPTTTNLCSTYNHQALNVNSDGYCYEVECATALQGSVLTGNSTTETSLKNCIGECTTYNIALPYGCVGVSYLGTSAGSGINCLLMSSVTGTMASANINSGRLLYAGYPLVNDAIYPLPSSSSTNPVAVASTMTTPIVPASSVATSPTTSTSYVPTVCPAAPTDASTICPGNSATCYQYSYFGNNDNYEIECSTQFTGSSSQPLLTFDLNDCVNQCQYANILRTNSCLGVSFVVNTIGQGSSNNCYPYSSITCGTRGNSTYNSARLLYAGYPRITDYTDPSFVCGGSTASAAASSAVSSRASTTTIRTM